MTQLKHATGPYLPEIQAVVDAARALQTALQHDKGISDQTMAASARLAHALAGLSMQGQPAR